MKLVMKQLAAVTALLATGMANAAIVNVPADTVVNGKTFSGTGALSFSPDLLGALDTGKVGVASYGAGTAIINKDSDGFYTSVTASAPITQLSVDTSNGEVVDSLTSGGATQTSPALKSVSSGGSVTVTDLDVDLTNKRVYATVIGANGVGTLSHFYLWDVASIDGPTKVGGPGTYTTTFSGLSITQSGFDTFTKALGLLNLGKSALLGVTSFGTITSTLTVTAVPEPSTYMLAGLGLAGICLATRRHRKL